jgi:fatty acid desaturase
MIGAVLDSGSPIPEGPLFSTRYFDDGSETIVDPFSDLARFAETYIGFIREQKRSATLAAVLFSAFAGIALFMAVIGISPVWCVLAGLGFAGVAAFMVVKLKAAAMVLAKCGSGQ